MKNWLTLRLVPILGAGAIRLLGKALRIESRGQEDLERLYRNGRAVIIAFWHGRQLMMPLAYRGKEAHILISQHRDGELIRRIVARFGFHAIRGSTTRGGTAALRRMIRIGKAGKDIVVTPDGPQGPRHIVQMGVIHLAKVTGMPIVPLGFGCSKKKSSKAGTGSWCHCRPRAVSSYGGRPSGFHPAPLKPNWNPNGWRLSGH